MAENSEVIAFNSSDRLESESSYTRSWPACIVLAICLGNPVMSFSQDNRLNELRIWNDTNGNEITARFVRYREGFVYLRNNSRRSVKIEPGQLSTKDQAYIAKLLRDSKDDKLADEFERLSKAGSKSGRANTGSGTATPGAPAASGGGRFTPPMRTPLGESPVVLDGGGGNSTRSPSPYVRTPDSDTWEPPKSSINVPKGSALDPFAESNPKRSKSSSSVSKVKNPDIDPFEEIKPTNSNSNPFVPTNSNRTTEQNTDSRQATNYQPPVLQNKTNDPITTLEQPTEAAEENSSTQSTILIALAIVGLLMLVMIALLVLVLVKAKQPQPRRGYF